MDTLITTLEATYRFEVCIDFLKSYSNLVENRYLLQVRKVSNRLNPAFVETRDLRNRNRSDQQEGNILHLRHDL